MGRAARNSQSRCILYADRITPEMQRAIDEVNRRRVKQLSHNATHGITPRTIVKENRRALEDQVASDRRSHSKRSPPREIPREQLADELEAEMLEAAAELQFERAAKLRDELTRVRAMTQDLVEANDDSEEERPRRLTPPGAPPGSPGSKARRGRKK